MYLDAHNHLQDERFGGRQDELVAAARGAGVARMVVNGSCEEDWPAVADLARRHPGFVLPSFGVHPWYVPGRSRDWEKRLLEFLNQTPSAVGEIGLDRWKEDLPWEGQEDVFVRQLRIAAERNLPASIHCLKAWGRLVELLETEPLPARGFLLHSYGGSADLVPRLAPLGACFSLPGYFAREGKDRHREAFRRVPPDRLLIETDAPDQSLPDARVTHPMENNLNHPANLGAVYAFAAELLQTPLAALAAQVESNFHRLFGISDKKPRMNTD
jgi:TatD DNase family protein